MTFVAQTPWSRARPRTLVVCCSDGRWHSQTMEFVHQEASERPDLYVVPGGPACVDAWSSSYGEARAFEEAMTLLAELHEIRHVWLIAHQECAYYAQKGPLLDAAALRQRQVDDLDRATQRLRERQPQWDIRCVYASRENGRVLFTVLEAASKDRRPSAP